MSGSEETKKYFLWFTEDWIRFQQEEMEETIQAMEENEHKN